MAKANITQYSATPSSNADINDINIAENCPASGLNNAIRELMAHLKNVDTGTQALTALSVAGSVTATTSLKTPLIEFTDGDNALTIADGGNVTANANLTVSGASTFNGNVELSATSPVLTVTATDTNQGTVLFKEGSTSKFNLSVVGSSDVFQIYNYNTSSQSMVINSSGQLGIGTSSPSQKLHVDSGSTDTVALFESSGDANAYLIIKDSGSSGGAFIGANGTSTIFGTGGNTERMRIDSSGNVFIGTTALPSGGGGYVGFEIAGSGRAILQCGTTATTSETLQRYYNPNGSVGSITVSGSSTAFNTSSDYRLKENVTYDFDATSRLKQLKPSRFNFKADADTTVDGFLAHEVASIVPEAINGEKDAVDDDGKPIYQGIDQSKLVPLLVKTIQELEARITALENA